MNLWLETLFLMAKAFQPRQPEYILKTLRMAIVSRAFRPPKPEDVKNAKRKQTNFDRL